MKKLAYVITQSEMGGAQKSILLLCEALKYTYDITVYSAPGGGMIDELRKLGVKHIEVGDMVREINPLKDFRAYKFLIKEFKAKGYDIVHCHSSKAGIIGREAAKVVGVKNIIFTAHGFVFNEPMSNLKKKIYKFIEKFEAKNTDTIICVDSNDVNIARSYNIVPNKNIIYIPNGIDFNSIIKNHDFSNDEIFTFGLVANFYETKGHRYLIKAFNDLINEGYNAKLLLIGDGMLKEEMMTLAKNNDKIIFMGYIKNAMEIMNKFHCFVLSSVKEGFPFVILEAVKNKVPIITTDVGAIPKMLNEGEFGVLVNKEDSNSIKEAMIEVMGNYEKAKCKAEKAYEFCKEKYSIETMINLTRNLYEED